MTVFLVFIMLAGRAEASAAAAKEQNWPQWRGPYGTGVAPTANPPINWSETKNVRWKVKIPGQGSATPIIWGDQIFLQTAVATGKTGSPATETASASTTTRNEGASGRRPSGGGGRRGFGAPPPTEYYQFVLLCLDRKTGKTLWQRVVREEVPHEAHHRDHGYASYSPVTDGKQVYAFFGSRGLYCYDMQGNKQWEKDLGKFQAKMGFGEGSSPALHGQTLVVNWDHEGEDFIVALDTATGKERWRQPRDEETAWSTPLIVEHAGQTQVITAATRKIRSYDLHTGKLIWECGGLTPNVIPTPVAGKGMVYVTSGFRGSALLAIRLGQTGDLTGTDAVVWSLNRSTPYVPSPLLYEDRLYFFASNSGRLTVCDAKSGRILVNAENLPALSGVYASPVGASGRIYLTGRNGAAMVLKASNQLEVLATNELDEEFDASPAAVDKELFLRGKEYLYCLAEQ